MYQNSAPQQESKEQAQGVKRTANEIENQTHGTKQEATTEVAEESKQYNLRKRNNIMPYVDGESDEEDFIYEQQMIGHDSKRAKEDDESYEEEDGV